MGKLVQFQTSAVNMTLNVREEILRKRICFTDEIEGLVASSLEWGHGSVRATVDRRFSMLWRQPFNDGALVSSLPGKRVDIVQPVRVALSTLDQMRVAGAGVPAVTTTLELNVILSVNASAQGDRAILQLRYEGIEGLPAGIPQLANLSAAIGAQFPVRDIPLDIVTLTTFERPIRIANVGVAAHVVSPASTPVSDPAHHSVPLPTNTIVVVRLELGNYPTDLTSWEQFLLDPQGVLFHPPGGDERSWAVFVDSFFVTEQVRNSLESDLATSDKFRLQGGVAVAWTAPDPSRGHVHVDFYGDAIDACEVRDVGMRIASLTEVTVIGPGSAWPRPYEPGTIHKHTRIHNWKDDWDVAFCVAIGSLAWPYVGPKLFDAEHLNLFELVSSFVAPHTINFLMLREIHRPGQMEPPGTTCTRIDGKDEFVCDQPFKGGATPLGADVELHALNARADGMTLWGRVYWRERLGRRFSLSGISTRAFEMMTVPLNCNQVGPGGLALIGTHPEWFASYNATITVDFSLNALSAENGTDLISTSTVLSRQIPSHICMARVLPADDPLNVFAPHITVDDSSPHFATVAIRVPAALVPDAYFAAPYECRVLIHTSDGARLITLPAIARASAQEIHDATIGAWASAVSNCYARSVRFNPRWIIDPSDLVERHRWELVVSGLRPGELVSMQSSAGQIAMQAQANAHGLATLAANLPAQIDTGGLSLVRSSSRTGERGSEAAPDMQTATEALGSRRRPAIDLKQVQLLHVADLGLRDAFVDAALLTLAGRPALAIINRDDVSFVDVSEPSQPVTVARLALGGVRGVFYAAAAAIAWGDHGVARLDWAPGLGEISATPILSDAVTGATSAGRRILAVRSGKVLVLGDGDRRCADEVDDAVCIGASHRFIVISNDERAYIFDARGDLDDEVAKHKIDDVMRIGPWLAPTGTNQRQFLLDTRTGAELIDVSDDGTVSVLQTFAQPQTVRTLRSGHVFVEIDAAAAQIHILRAGRAAWLRPEEDGR